MGNVPIFRRLHGHAHAELPRARLHAAPDHEAVARLEHVQRARDGRDGQRGDKDGDLVVRVLPCGRQLVQLFVVLPPPVETLVGHHHLHGVVHELRHGWTPLGQALRGA